MLSRNGVSQCLQVGEKFPVLGFESFMLAEQLGQITFSIDSLDLKNKEKVLVHLFILTPIRERLELSSGEKKSVQCSVFSN